MTIITENIQPMLDRKFPAALVAAFLLQTAGALFCSLAVLREGLKYYTRLQAVFDLCNTCPSWGKQ